MAEHPKRSRLYSEHEMGLLIQRATELQQAKDDALEHGLTFEEIERIATELGLDSDSLRTAAMDLDEGFGNQKTNGFFGGPFEIELKRVVEGAMTEEEWGDIVQELRRIKGHSGKVSEIGKTKEWTHAIDAGLGFTRVSISPRNEQSTILIQDRYKGWAILLYVAALFGGIALPGFIISAEGIVLPDLMEPIVLGGGIATVFAVVRTGLSIWGRKQREKLQHVLSRISANLSSAPVDEVQDGLETIGGRVEPVIDLPEELKDEAERSGGASRVLSRE